MSRIFKFIFVLSSGLLMACQTTMDMPTDGFGAAVKHNIAAQAVEPTPEQKQNTYIQPDSQRMAVARERYKKDQVERPTDLQTTAELSLIHI